MAIFTQATESKLLNGRLIDDKNDNRVADYLYELNENLSYMFNNLSPEDNYSEDARLIYVQRGKRLGTLEVRADAIELRVQDDERNYNTSMQLFADLLKLTASTPTGSSTIAMTGDKIELTTGKFIVNSTNLQIDAQGNGTFSGTVRAASIISSTVTGGTISGTTVSASTINGGTINGTSINGGDSIRFKARPGYLQFGDFEVDDTYGRHIFQSYDEVTGMSTGDDVIGTGDLLLWAGWDADDEEAYFLVNGQGRTEVNGTFRVNGTMYYNNQTLRSYIEDVIDDYGGGNSSSGSGGSSPGGSSSGGDSGGGPTGDENDPLLGG